jgi:hypothetical protein
MAYERTEEEKGTSAATLVVLCHWPKFGRTQFYCPLSNRRILMAFKKVPSAIW